MADSPCPPMEDTYHPEPDVEYLENYVPGGYHPTLIGDTFCSSFRSLGLVDIQQFNNLVRRDQQRQRYVSPKILTAREWPVSYEGKVLQYLMKNDLTHAGKQFIPPLLDQFSFHGPNGHHQCLVGEPAGVSIAKSKKDSENFMFPADAARSTAAQILLGLSYLHANGICHGDLHLRNFLLRIPNFDGLSTAELYKRFGKPCEVPIRRLDGKTGEPHAPPHTIFPMALNMPANELDRSEIIISDYGTSFFVSHVPSPTLYTPALYSPPKDFFDGPINQPTAADIWTLGVNLYEVLGERPVFETFSWDRDDIVGEMINTLGRPPVRWWNSWVNRPEFFKEDGSWVADFSRISTPVFRRLHQRLWNIGRSEAEKTCEWDVAGGELRALEDFLRAMMTFEPVERPTPDPLLRSEYMVRWALAAWERQKRQKSAHHANDGIRVSAS